MKLVIEIPEEVYRAYKMDVTLGCLNEDQRGYAKWYLIHGLVNGTPLPKNCRLIDTNALPNEVQSLYSIRTAPTIIEADGGDGMMKWVKEHKASSTGAEGSKE